MANPFYVEPANPLQALMLGQQSYGKAREGTIADEASKLYASGDTQGALARLLGANNPQMAKVISDMSLAKSNADLQRQMFGETVRHHKVVENKPLQVGSPDTGYHLVYPSGTAPGTGPFPDPPSPNATFPQGQPAGAVQVVPPRAKPQKDVSASELKMIQKDEDELPGIEATIRDVTRAKELNSTVYWGVGASALGKAGTSGIPGVGFALDPSRAAATAEWDQIMGGEAIKSMSETLKGASTDFEMRKFISIAADTSKPPEVRERAMDRFLALAQREIEIKKTRLDQLRARTYGQPGGGQSAAPAATQNDPRPISEAREAIARGADRGAVEKRLRERGVKFDPRDLDLQ